MGYKGEGAAPRPLQKKITNEEGVIMYILQELWLTIKYQQPPPAPPPQKKKWTIGFLFSLLWLSSLSQSYLASFGAKPVTN